MLLVLGWRGSGFHPRALRVRDSVELVGSPPLLKSVGATDRFGRHAVPSSEPRSTGVRVDLGVEIEHRPSASYSDAGASGGYSPLGRRRLTTDVPSSPTSTASTVTNVSATGKELPAVPRPCRQLCRYFVNDELTMVPFSMSMTHTVGGAPGTKRPMLGGHSNPALPVVASERLGTPHDRASWGHPKQVGERMPRQDAFGSAVWI
jgi:hypothetical protein